MLTVRISLLLFGVLLNQKLNMYFVFNEFNLTYFSLLNKGYTKSNSDQNIYAKIGTFWYDGNTADGPMIQVEFV